MAELLSPGTPVTRISVGRGSEYLSRELRGAERLAKFEVGFGSPTEQFTKPSLQLSSLKELFSGQSLIDVPLLLPTLASHGPLAASVAQSFPILIRGTITLSDLTIERDDLVAEGFPELRPYREARGRLRALNVQEIQLCSPNFNRGSEYYPQIQSQLEQRMLKLRELFLRSDSSHDTRHQ